MRHLDDIEKKNRIVIQGVSTKGQRLIKVWALIIVQFFSNWGHALGFVMTHKGYERGLEQRPIGAVQSRIDKFVGTFQ
jgi:hypothetical protein